MGMGSIQQPELVKGRWRVRVWWNGADGRRRSSYVYGATEREALKLAQARQAKESGDVQRELAGLLVRRPACPTLTEYVLEHHETIWAQCAERGRRNHLAALGRWVEPTLGQRRLDEITRGDIAAIVGGLRKAGRAAGTANRIVSALSLVLNHAQAAELVAVNVCRIPGPRIMSREQLGEVETYTAEEVHQVVAAALADPRTGSTWGRFIALAAFTGGRPKSVRMLRVGDLRLEADPPAVVYRRTKSGKDLVVPLVPHLVELLRPLVSGRPLEEWLFPARAIGGAPDLSRPVHETSFQRPWKAAVEAAGVRLLGFYALRRSFVTLALDRGISASIVRDLVGHSSLVVTNRYAGQATRSAQAVALDSLWRGADAVQSGPATGDIE